MNVAAILARKGADVVTADPADTLEDAARILAANRIGAVVILQPDGAVAGVLSERDITAAVAQAGAAALSLSVEQVMSRDVVVCSPGDTVDSLMARMTDRRIRHLPVVQGGRLAGVVSIGDLVKQKIADAEAETEAMKAYIATA